MVLHPCLLPRFARPAGGWKTGMVSGGGELAGVSVMVRDFGFRPDCGCLSLITLISMVSKSHSFCHLPAHQSAHYTFSLSLSFTIYRGNVIFPQGCCTGYVKLMKCQLTDWEVLPLWSDPGRHCLTLPPEPDSPCPGGHSHTLWAHRAWQTLGHCHSHP